MIVEVRRIHAAEGPQLRVIRLRALADDPAAFSSTYAREEHLLACVGRRERCGVVRQGTQPDHAQLRTLSGVDPADLDDHLAIITRDASLGNARAAVPQAPKLTVGASRTSGSSASKYSARTKWNIPAMMFVGTVSIFVLSCRTFAL